MSELCGWRPNPNPDATPGWNWGFADSPPCYMADPIIITPHRGHTPLWGRPYLARLTDLHPTYVFERQFVRHPRPGDALSADPRTFALSFLGPGIYEVSAGEKRNRGYLLVNENSQVVDCTQDLTKAKDWVGMQVEHGAFAGAVREPGIARPVVDPAEAAWRRAPLDDRCDLCDCLKVRHLPDLPHGCADCARSDRCPGWRPVTDPRKIKAWALADKLASLGG